MPRKVTGEPKSINQHRLHWILVILIFGVLTLSILAFISPISQGMGESTPTVEITADVTSTSVLTQTPVPLAMQEETTVSPEDIGYTDQIIFWSTVLMMILLVATLRETTFWKP